MKFNPVLTSQTSVIKLINTMSTTSDSPSPSPVPKRKKSATLRKSAGSTNNEQEGDDSAVVVAQHPRPEIIRAIKELLATSDLSQKRMAQELNISQTKVSQFLNSVPRTKGWGSFEEKVIAWIKSYCERIGRDMNDLNSMKERPEENPDYDLEVSPLSFSADSMTSSDSMDGIVIHSPNSPMYMVPYSAIPAQNLQLFLSYGHQMQGMPQMLPNGMPVLTKSFSWPQPRRAVYPAYEGYYIPESKSEYAPSPRDLHWDAKVVYSSPYSSAESMDTEPTSIQENDWSTFSLNEVFEKKPNGEVNV